MMFKKLALILTIFALMIAFESCKRGDSKPAVKIDDDVITIGEFNKYYYYQNKLVLNLDKMDKKKIDKLAKDPAYERYRTLNKKEFMDQLINLKVIYKKAMDDDDIDKEEMQTLMELTKLNAIAQYYLAKKFDEKLEITDAELEQFMNENRDRVKGATINEVENYLKQLKFMSKSNELVNELKAESKINREGFKQYLKEIDKDSSEKDSDKKADEGETVKETKQDNSEEEKMKE